MDQLKRLRVEKGLSQARLAARAGLDPSTVNQIERGAREASPVTLRKLADALDISIAGLLESKPPKAQAPLPLESEAAGHRRTEDYTRGAAALSRFCAYWENRLDSGELDQRSLEDFHIAAEGFVPLLKIAIDIEKQAAVGTELEQVVMDRFIVLGTRMSRARDKAFTESAGSSTITQLRDYVRRAG